jgi:hypothetical protein
MFLATMSWSGKWPASAMRGSNSEGRRTAKGILASGNERGVFGGWNAMMRDVSGAGGGWVGERVGINGIGGVAPGLDLLGNALRVRGCELKKRSLADSRRGSGKWLVGESGYGLGNTNGLSTRRVDTAWAIPKG